MPCYEVRTVTVEFNNHNKSLLVGALKSIGATYTVDGNKFSVGYGSAVIDLDKQTAVGSMDLINKVKQAYSREAVKAAAKKFGWVQKTQGSQINVTKMRW